MSKQEKPIGRHHILIADDSEINRLVVNKVLSPYGTTVMVADGKAGYDAFIATQKSDKPFTLVCLDIMMPEIDGMTLLKMMRKFEQTENIPAERKATIVMTTALGDKEHVVQAIEAGCDGYILKPYDRSKIISRMRQIGVDL
jgi:two-component system chemotaxis response regulator CheY